jgi:hypothetical protein
MTTPANETQPPMNEPAASGEEQFSANDLPPRDQPDQPDHLQDDPPTSPTSSGGDSHALPRTPETKSLHAELVSDARRYRKRAQAAEKTVEQLTSELASRDSVIAGQNETISALKRRQAIEEQLRTAGAHDVDAARLLAEEALAAEGSLSIEDAVERVKAAKPWLFQSARVRSSGLAGAMSPSAMDRNSVAGSRSQRLNDAAEEAHASGSRRDVLRYLRLRRRRTAQ